MRDSGLQISDDGSRQPVEVVCFCIIGADNSCKASDRNVFQTKMIEGEHDMKIKFLENEYWWGGLSEDGLNMPYGANSNMKVDLCRDAVSNQYVSLFVSNQGRILFREQLYEIVFEHGEITCPDDIVLQEGYGDLRTAYLTAMRAFFPFDGDIPDETFFKVPQYNTWIEMHLEQNQEGIINYAKSILDNGMAAGIIMIDEGWALYNGCFKINQGKFPDLKKWPSSFMRWGLKLWFG